MCIRDRYQRRVHGTAKYDSDTSHYSKEALASVCATTNVMIKITTDRTVFGAYFFSELLNNDNSISDKNAAIFILTNGTIANIEQTTGFLKAFRWGPSEKVFNLGDVEVDLAESDESTTTVTVKPSTTYNTPDNDIYYPSTTTFLATRLVASTFSLSKPQLLSLIHISEPTRPLYISYAVFCLKKKKKKMNETN
eukprot:TRINITY_DN7310_c0_g1_i4.p2 TRINITY_DN7310_c0_g1~~TRINITY_DN7310_c0_g1_i4.p2  ORF type:complete len:194 (-),score=35.71 TRINITY_DN7310_c0_g1_i4:98-679(-)